ncbi:glycosyltransferase, partial [Streptomyces carpinensis]
HAPLALLVAGSWGVGPVRRAAAEIQQTGIAVPVVVCGRNHALAEQLRRDGIEHVFGWVDDMPGLMHACDVLVQNAGGLTSLEALAAGLPVASYRCIPGHGRTNAEALDEAGLAAWIRGPGDLGPVLTELLDGPRGQAQRAAGIALHRFGPGPVPAIAARTGSRPSPPAPPTARRPGRRRIALAAVTAAATVSLGVAAPLAYAYTEAPARFTAVAHYLDGDRR